MVSPQLLPSAVVIQHTLSQVKWWMWWFGQWNAEHLPICALWQHIRGKACTKNWTLNLTAVKMLIRWRDLRWNNHGNSFFQALWRLDSTYLQISVKSRTWLYPRVTFMTETHWNQGQLRMKYNADLLSTPTLTHTWSVLSMQPPKWSQMTENCSKSEAERKTNTWKWTVRRGQSPKTK